ncbi:MFS transporter [Demequina mangrovi]|uniref:Transmembrane secretion effector n=1 Tax=Demequina mangrovi TaxID=1043493 RepID=A0A1H7ASK0_9MICO|nr:MFS transporter [Demequina mangrovi]SEJ67916.1 Transmembrane secretion effector [Demequina mangrovi]
MTQDPQTSSDASGAPASSRRGLSRHLVDIAPLKASPAFARLWIGGAISGVGAFMTTVAVGLQIYEITESTFAVGLVGGIALVPMIAAGLWGGVLADVFDRRKVVIASSLASWASILALVVLAFWEQHLQGLGTHAPVWPFYLVTTVNAITSTVSNATRGSVVGRILPADMLSRATALNGISFGAMVTVGPALAGVLAASIGLPWTFAIDAVLFTAGFLGIWMLPSLPRLGERVEAGWPVLKEGLTFLRRSPNIRMSFIVDAIAMTFGRPYALFPALGALVVGGGALTVGALTAAGAIGTMLTSLFSGRIAHVHRHGIAISRAIQVFGAFAVLFGVFTWVGMHSGHAAGEGWGGTDFSTLALMALAMAGMGASDELSAIFRQTMIIQAAPDEMRGRLQGVFIVVVTGGPRLGDMYAGALAAVTALWFPPLLGGFVIIALIVILTRAQRAWREYDATSPTP